MSSSDAPTPVNPEPSPTKLEAVTIPATILPLVNTVAPVLTDNLDPSKVKDDSPFNVLAVPDPVINLLSAFVLIVTPAGNPVKFAPLPTKLVAVTIPANVALPLAAIVAAVPTLRPPVAVATPVILTLLKNVAGVPV